MRPRYIRDLLLADLQASLKANPHRARWVWWGFVLVKSYGLPRVRVLWCYRLGQLLLGWGLTPLAWLLVRHSMRVCGAEIDPRARIGGGLDVWHTAGVVIGKDAVIGRNATILQGVTIGIASPRQPGMARIGDDVFIGSGAIIIGPITIGDGARIGANATVTKDVPDGGVVTGPRAQQRPPPAVTGIVPTAVPAQATPVGTTVGFTHPHPSSGGELCRMCARPASHKVEESTWDERHPFTGYLCCEHFGAVMGPVARRSMCLADFKSL